MKKKIIISVVLMIVLFVSYITFLFISATVNSSKTQAEKEYLPELYNHYPSTISDLEKQGISASYDDKRKELIINSSEAKYYFSSEGAVFISTENCFINITSRSDNGKIEKIDIYIGDSIGSTHNKYNVNDLSKPEPYYLGNDEKSADDIIKKNLPNEKIEELISQSEKYQEMIKESIDEKKY